MRFYSKITLLLLFSFSSVFSQNNRIALLDLTARNAESTDGNRFSAEHLLKVSGLPYFVTDSVELARTSNFILCTSNIESYSFSSAEKDSLRAFVQNGGTLFTTQLKDTTLFDVFGVSDYSFGTQRYEYHWVIDSTDVSFRWLNDVNEKMIFLGDTSYAAIFPTRSYTLTTASSLATFENDSIALTKNNYGSGHAFNLGINWEDVFLRNQVKKSYEANRTYSNGFEPGSDVFILFIRALYAKYNPYAVWKHTSGLDSRSTLVITHDVDATSSINHIMNGFASYEYENNIKATYFITTHYIHDSVAKNFWNGFEQKIRDVKDRGHFLASHSVGHVPDFDIESTVPEGSCGNTEISYQPFYNGTFSNNVTVCGEVEVSKLLLDRDINANVRSFRAGYLAYNNKILNSLETNGYEFNSSHSANDVLTSFPFQGHLDLSMTGAASSILEIPNTISDVFKSDAITETNYMEKVGIWLDAAERNAQNNAPTILLIHPNRNYKIMALQNMLRALPSSTRIVPFEHFGDYWNARNNCELDYLNVNDTLFITVKNTSLPLHPDLSFIVDNGMLLYEIRIQDESGNPVPMIQSQWETQSKILYSEQFTANYTDFYYTPGTAAQVFENYPNPFSTSTTFSFELMETTDVTLKIYDVTGRLVEKPVSEVLELGLYTYTYENTDLREGLYFYEFTFGENKPVINKMIVVGEGK